MRAVVHAVRLLSRLFALQSGCHACLLRSAAVMYSRSLRSAASETFGFLVRGHSPYTDIAIIISVSKLPALLIPLSVHCSLLSRTLYHKESINGSFKFLSQNAGNL